MAANDDDPNGKNALRARLRTRRDALPEAARAAWSRHLAEAGAAALRERIVRKQLASSEMAAGLDRQELPVTHN